MVDVTPNGSIVCFMLDPEWWSGATPVESLPPAVEFPQIGSFVDVEDFRDVGLLRSRGDDDGQHERRDSNIESRNLHRPRVRRSPWVLQL